MPSPSLQMLKPEQEGEANELKQLSALPLTRRQRHSQETIARLDRLWLQNPEFYKPDATALERLRIECSKKPLKELQGLSIVDFGAGYAPLAPHCLELGAQYCAVDASSNALKQASKACSGIKTRREVLPQSSLEDRSYDLVLCLELIAELPKRDHRLLFSEAARVLKPKGRLVFSTAVTPASDALLQLQDLVGSEFEVEEVQFSYHRLSNAFLELLKTPAAFAASSVNPRIRRQELTKRRQGLPRWWFRLNSQRFLGKLWALVARGLKPLLHRVEQSHWLCQRLERWSQWLWDENGITDVTLIARKKRLVGF